MNKQGKLYIIGVPIGNYDDLSFRALSILKKVSLILCEDTRETTLLLNNFLIKKELISYVGSKNYIYKKSYQIIQEGKDIAIVSDRGMPTISDPGADIINYYRNLNIEIKIIPGPCSVTSAFCLSGLKGGYLFHGFLPRKKGAILQIFEKLKELKYNLIFFEAPLRVLETIQLMKTVFIDKKIIIARELTKTYEELIIYHNEIKEIKGECVILVENY